MANATMPEGVKQFFDGMPMKDKHEAMISQLYSPEHKLSFEGPYAPPVPVLELEKFKGALKNLMASFPDLTFNLHKVQPTKQADGAWAADIVVMGTHTAAPFTPMPGKLPPVDTTGKQVLIGPETFALYTDDAGKVVKTTITPKHEGAPAGPPGFYTEIGGVIPKPLPDMVMTTTLKDFDDWFAGFKEHGASTTFTIGGKTFKDAPITRGDAMDEARTEVFVDVDDNNKALITMFAVNMDKFGSFFAWDKFKEMNELCIVAQDPPMLLKDPPAPGAAPPAGAGGKPDMFVSLEVADVDKWVAGFKAHATNKKGTWGDVESKYARAEICDDAKTRVFRSAHNPKRVGALICGIDMAKMGEMMADPSWAKISQALGEKGPTTAIKTVVPAPPPPKAAAAAPAPPQAIAA